MEIGLFTFGETPFDPRTGEQLDAGTRLRNLVEEIELADQVGLDVYGVGEHHRPDYAVSAPAVVLAAGAARTRRIRLTSSVSVLSSDDPVRVFQQFATLDLLSGGRAELMVGRGSFIESFPLFGYDLDDYAALFEEKLELLLRLRAAPVVTWEGGQRPAIPGLGVWPRPEQDPLPIWVAVGGTPSSVERVGRLGLPMALAIIGGVPARFRSVVEGYRAAWASAGHPEGEARVSINSHGFIAGDGARARELALPAIAGTMNRIGRERGWPPMHPSRLLAETGADGPLFVGDPEEVAEKIVAQHAIFRHDRFLLQLTVGPVPHKEVLRAIELYGTEVAPRVRRALGTASPTDASQARIAAFTPAPHR